MGMSDYDRKAVEKWLPLFKIETETSAEANSKENWYHLFFKDRSYDNSPGGLGSMTYLRSEVNL